MKRLQFLKDTRDLNLNQLYGKLNEARNKQFELRQSQILGNLKNSAELRVARKNIAIISTVIDQKISEKLEKE